MSNSGKYYVYKVLGKSGELLYIGKGSGERYKVHLCGKSSNRYLNEYFFYNGQDGCMTSEIIYTNLNQDEAFKLETDMILDLQPVCNINLSTSKHSKKKPLKLLVESDLDAYRKNSKVSKSIEKEQQIKVLDDEDRKKIEAYNSIEIHEGRREMFVHILQHGNKGSKFYSNMFSVCQRTAKRWLLQIARDTTG